MLAIQTTIHQRRGLCQAAASVVTAGGRCWSNEAAAVKQNNRSTAGILLHSSLRRLFSNLSSDEVIATATADPSSSSSSVPSSPPSLNKKCDDDVNEYDLYTSAAVSTSSRRKRPPQSSRLAASTSTRRLRRNNNNGVRGRDSEREIEDAVAAQTPPEQNNFEDDHTVLRAWTQWRQGYIDDDDPDPQPWGAHEEFLRALPKDDATVDEVVAAADRFLLLLENSPEATWCRAKILGDVDTIVEGRGGKEGGSVGRLHYALLRMIERCLPPSTTVGIRGGGINTNNGVQQQLLSNDERLLYSATTVERAWRLTRRAEELGLPPHRPLYRRLAVGITLMSTNDAPIVGTPSDLTRFVRLGETLETIASPLSLELLTILDGARSSLGFQSGNGEGLRQLAEDVLVDPFLLLLATRRLEDAAALYSSWHAFQIDNDMNREVNMMSLLGEGNVLRALEIAKEWPLDDPDFAKRVSSNQDVTLLARMMEEALDEVVRGRRLKAQRISDIMWEMSLRSEEDEDHYDDFEDDDAEGDYDSDEDDFDYDSDEDEDVEEVLDSLKARNIEASDIAKGRRINAVETEYLTDLGTIDEDSKTMSFKANTSNKSSYESDDDEDYDDDDSYTIIRGLSNKDARRSIYLRNSREWQLNDIVPQLQDWNHGRRLTFTPLFEKYIGNQISQAYDEEEGEVNE